MGSQAVTPTPKNIVAALSLAVDAEYYIQCSGDFEIALHEDRTNRLNAGSVEAAAGPRPFRLTPWSQRPLRYKVRADTPLWVWAPGLVSAVAVLQAP